MKQKEKQKAVFIKTFKTKRADGHSVRTIYALLENGIVNIERRYVSTQLNPKCIELRRFGKYVYQYESLVFKLTSFMRIANEVAEHIHDLKIDDIILHDEILFKPNEDSRVEIYI